MILYAILLLQVFTTNAIDLTYLDPTTLQTRTAASVQQNAAANIIRKYLSDVVVVVDPLLFQDHKDKFSLRTDGGQLHIRASTGVAAVWGFNYFLKKYCKSQIAWQVSRVQIPNPLPSVDEVVVANDRFRYYQNVCTASYSFVWWDVDTWMAHVEWMALNGINLALAPVAQEAAWAKVFQRVGMTQDEINDYFTGPAFLSWLRMGNVHGWGGPLVQSWHDRQRNIQDKVIDYMFQLGMIPVYPAFNGHVPTAFARLYPNATFYSVGKWNQFNKDYCCGLFVDPEKPLFHQLGRLFLKEISLSSSVSHIYSADPFNEVNIDPWSNTLVIQTARSIYSTLLNYDENAVWLVQNWMFVHDPILWPMSRVQSFLTSVPNGRMLVLDLQSEQWPQYELYKMYYGQPFIWCMLHNFGGTLGMFGNMKSINRDVYEARTLANSTMIGIGLTPEGINQNYVMYDLMLESGWRKNPVNLEEWVADYAERRYGCNSTSAAWRYLVKSVYNFDGLNKIRGKYVITRRPSFRIRPWAWYRSYDLFQAFRIFAMNGDCDSDGFYHDLVDVTRQSLQYRAEQLYMRVLDSRTSSTWVFNSSISQFLDVMTDIQSILASHKDFSVSDWLNNAKSIASGDRESLLFDFNARNQITLWGPNGEITDYACKQWAELFAYYYIPRWRTFLMAALDAKARKEAFDEKRTQSIVRATVEEHFLTVEIDSLPRYEPRSLAFTLYEKWAFAPDLDDLPQNIIYMDPLKMTTMLDVAEYEIDSDVPTVTLSTTKSNF